MIVDLRQITPVNTGVSVVIENSFASMLLVGSFENGDLFWVRSDSKAALLKQLKQHGLNDIIISASKLEVLLVIFREKIKNKKIKLINFNLPKISLISILCSEVHTICHDFFPLSVPNYHSRFKTFLYYFYCLFAVSVATKIVCVSDQTKFDLINFYGVTNLPKTSVRYLGLPVGINIATKSTLKKSNLQKILYYIGDDRKNKNLDLALALGQELATRLCTKFVVLTRLPEMALRKKYAIGDRVRIISGDNDIARNKILESRNCLIFPSKTEGFGLPVLEAYLNDHYIITSPEVPMHALINKNALSYYDDEIGDLTRKVGIFFDDFEAKPASRSEVKYWRSRWRKLSTKLIS